MWLTKTITDCKKSTDYQAVLAVSVFLLTALLVPSVKVFFVLAFGFFSFLVWRYGFVKAFIYSFMPLSIVSMAQTHSVVVVPASAIVSHQYWEGKHLSYGFAPQFFINITALLAIPLWLTKARVKIKLEATHVWLIIFISLGILSAIYGSLFPGISLLSVIGQLSGLSVVFYLLYFFNQQRSAALRQRLIASLFMIVSTLIVFESAIVLGQTLKQSPLGFAIEKTAFAPAFGLGADESGGFRPFGLQAHPNGLANQQLILLNSALLLFIVLRRAKQPLFISQSMWLISGLALINVGLSLSRAAYIALAVVVVFWWTRHPQLLQNIINNWQRQIYGLPNLIKATLVIITGLLLMKSSNRLLYSIYSFSEFGGVSTRAVQYAEATEVFKQSPWLGIGDQMFIPTSYQLFPKGVMTYFPENIHNGFLLTTIERGLLGATAYSLFLLLFIKKIQQSGIKKTNRSVIYLGLLVGFIMMIFHPERNLLNLFVLLTLGSYAQLQTITKQT